MDSVVFQQQGGSVIHESIVSHILFYFGCHGAVNTVPCPVQQDPVCPACV